MNFCLTLPHIFVPHRRVSRRISSHMGIHLGSRTRVTCLVDRFRMAESDRVPSRHDEIKAFLRRKCIELPGKLAQVEALACFFHYPVNAEFR